MKEYYVYILSNKNRTVLYIGYTNNLKRRISQHKRGNGALFTRKYKAIQLIYFETFYEKARAKKRERQLKNWHKDWKWNLIKESNPSLEVLEFN